MPRRSYYSVMTVFFFFFTQRSPSSLPKTENPGNPGYMVHWLCIAWCLAAKTPDDTWQACAHLQQSAAELVAELTVSQDGVLR